VVESLISGLGHEVCFAAEGPIPSVRGEYGRVNDHRCARREHHLVSRGNPALDHIDTADMAKGGLQQKFRADNVRLHGRYNIFDFIARLKLLQPLLYGITANPLYPLKVIVGLSYIDRPDKLRPVTFITRRNLHQQTVTNL